VSDDERPHPNDEGNDSERLSLTEAAAALDEAFGSYYLEPVGERLTPEEIAALGPDDVEDVSDQVLEIGGEYFVRRSGPAAEVRLFRDGEPLTDTPIIIGADPSTPEEELERLAVELYDDFQAVTGQFSDEYVAGFVATLEDAYFRPITDEVIAFLRDVAKVRVDKDAETLTGEEDLALEPYEYAPVEERTNELLHEELARITREVFLEGESGATFKTGQAREILGHAWAWAVADAREAVTNSGRSLDDITDDEFEAEVDALFQAGTYVTRAWLTSAEHTIRGMAKVILESLGDSTELPRTIARAVRDELRGTPRQRSDLPTLPGFVDGYGAVASDQVTAGLWASLAAAADRVGWQNGPTGYPYFPHQGTTYSLEEAAYATAQAALEEVDRMGDRDADAYDALCAAWARNATSTGDFVTLSLDDTLSRLGYAKHQKGGYRREHRDELRARLVRLSKVRVNSPAFTRWEEETGPGGKRRRIERTYRIEDEPVLFLGGSLAQIDLEGVSHRAAVRVRPGETIARSLSGPVGRQFAYMSEQLLALDGKAIYPKRIGRYFHRLWRIRATKGTHDDGVRVATMLEGASAQLPDRNRDRFRRRIEEALDELRDAAIFGAWHYQGGDPPTTGRGWAEAWLEAKVCVAPPPALREAYKTLEGKRRPTRRALPAPSAGGT